MGVKQAHLRAPASGYKCAQVAGEDAAEGMRGKLNASLCGARDAARSWREKDVEVLREVGFVVGKASPCLVWSEARDLWLVGRSGVFDA